MISHNQELVEIAEKAEKVTIENIFRGKKTMFIMKN
jgi:hypothetical protein